MCPETDAADPEAAGRVEINDALRLCRSAMTASPLPCAVVEGREHAVRYVNPAFCQLVGKTEYELADQPFGLAVAQGRENGCLALLDRVFHTGAAETLTDQEHTPGGSSLPSASLSSASLSSASLSSASLSSSSASSLADFALSASPSCVYWSYTAWPIFAVQGHAAATMIQVTDTTSGALFRQQVTMVNQELLLSSVRQHELREVAEALNARLQTLATTDGLTGLNNHRTFQELLLEEVERSRRYNTPLSLLFLDVDDFKVYNDTFGHPAGDQVLRGVGEVLKATTRASDPVARYGGEEFAVILVETDAASARTAAERFRAAIERAVWQERPITISVGAATLSRTASAAAALIAQADIALYRSKARGRNCVTHVADAQSEGRSDEHSNAHSEHRNAHSEHSNAHDNRDGVVEGTVKAETPDTASRRHTPSFAASSAAPRVQQALSEFRAAVEDALETVGESLWRSQEATVACLSRLVNLWDEDTQAHSARSTEMMVNLARTMGMNAQDVLAVRWGGLLHDIGKIGVPAAILHKPAALTSEERAIMERHPIFASEMLASMPFLAGPALDIVLHHHEKWDGSGYPYGLAGEAIPQSARLFAVIDVYDALLTDRPYRKAWTEHEARQYLRAGVGTHFDPDAVNAFIALLEAQDAHEA